MVSQIELDLQLTGVAQVLVVLNDAADAQAELGASARALSPYLDETPMLSRVAPDTVLSLRENFETSEYSQDSALASALPGAAGPPTAGSFGGGVRYFPNLGVMLGTVGEQGLAALRANPAVDAVEGTSLLLPIRPMKVASAKLSDENTWGLRKMRIPELWKQGLSGEGVLVGHLDTGVDGTHRALRGDAIAEFAEFDVMGHQTNVTDPYDSEDHGTHTAGTIAGRPRGARHFGVAPGAKLASAIVIEGGNVVARVLAGMDWAVSKRVRVLNMSLGFPGYVAYFLQLTRILRARNILPVFAVGNEGPGTSRSPGNYAEAVSVGAVDKQDAVASFSSSQEFRRSEDRIVPDLVAPGVDVISARPGGGYQSMDGSSMATPHVAGLAALLLEAKPDVTVDELENAIFGSCDGTGIPPNRGGRGIPDGPQALSLL